MSIINEIAAHSDGTICTIATTTGDCPFNHDYTPATSSAAGVKGLLITTDGQVAVTAFGGLEDYQRAVGGYIETVELGNGHDLVANEEGLIYQLPFNQVASMVSQRPILGNAILIGFQRSSGGFVDVDEDLADKIRQLTRG